MDEGNLLAVGDVVSKEQTSRGNVVRRKGALKLRVGETLHTR